VIDKEEEKNENNTFEKENYSVFGFSADTCNVICTFAYFAYE